MEPDEIDAIMAAWAEEMPDADFSRFEAHLRLTRTASFFGQRVEQTVAAFGLDLGQWAVLTALRRTGAPYCLTSTELARSTLCTTSAVTKRVDRLERSGLAIRLPDPSDRRSILVGLTPAGIDLTTVTAVQTTAVVHDVLGALSDAERDSMTSLLRKLQARLDETVSPAAAGREPAAIDGVAVP